MMSNVLNKISPNSTRFIECFSLLVDLDASATLISGYFNAGVTVEKLRHFASTVNKELLKR